MVDFSNVSTTIGQIKGLVGQNPLGSLIGASAIGVGLGVGASAIVGGIKKKRSKRKSKRKSANKSRARKGRKLKFGSPAYRKKYLGKGKRRSKHTKRTSHKRIRYTKNNQPYIILASGKARFIKKSSASRSRKLKGGRY